MNSELETARFEGRKRDHIALALNSVHQASGLSGLDAVRLAHEALPELDLDQVSLEEACLGQRLKTPFFIAAMTMGHSDASGLNRDLARACQSRGWAMGVGSQRRDLEGRAIEGEGKRLRQAAPRAVLFANIGISQLTGSPSMDRVRRLVDSIEAQALVVHLNALQESLQPEGTPQFKGGLKAIQSLAKSLSVPVVVKETGCGFSESTLRRLKSAGVAAVDVSGLGGTHWGRIEGARSEAGSIHARAAQVFADWGVSTRDSMLAAKKALSRSGGKRYSIWASGGVRSGLDAAKLIALGAERVGFAQPALEALLKGPETLEQWMQAIEFELTVALFCTGCATPLRLRRKGIQA